MYLYIYMILYLEKTGIALLGAFGGGAEGGKGIGPHQEHPSSALASPTPPPSLVGYGESSSHTVFDPIHLGAARQQLRANKGL